MKVHLKVKENNKVETIPHEVEELNIFQVTRAIKVVKDIISLVQDDNNLQALLVEVLDDDKKEGEEAVDESGQRIVQRAIGAMDVLLMEIPDKAVELLSVLSGIEHDTFMQQKTEDVFDIYDAVIQVNDLEKLVKRAKKSFDLTKGQVKVMSLFQKKEQPAQKQA